MTRTNFTEAVMLEISGEPARPLPLNEAVQVVIALPQKQGRSVKITRVGRPPISDYSKIVALFQRRDFPD